MKNDIDKAIDILKKGGVILYPTDSVWGIGCDATSEEAVAKIYAIKKHQESKMMICLVANQFMLEQHVNKVPETAYDIMDFSEKPVTIIYDQPKNIAKNLIASDNTLAIRVASDPFCQRLINSFKKPIVATSANITGQPTPTNFSEIEETILKAVDYTVSVGRDIQNKSASTIIKLGNDGTVKIIRK